MSAEFQKRNAIDFLDLVREDLQKIGASVASDNLSTPQFADSDYDTVIADADDSPSWLGRFKILEQVGEGGFARVFVANDPSLDREVALKVPKPHVLVSSEARSRFEREAKSAAILSHPNIVPVFEIGSAGPIHFIASEYCPGQNLRAWFADSKEKSELRTVVKIVSQLADALQHAHRRGIVHRDLKPANVLVIEGDEDVSSRLRITDFGLARQVASDDTLTATGSIVGTPAYMSPEQAEGIAKVDHRTDVYSLGMVLYELLTGTTPFKRSSHIASIAAVINEPVPPLREANKKVDADLEAICLKALEKDPDRRYQSAHDLKRDLNRWLNGYPVSVRKLSRPQVLRRWMSRNPWVASAIGFGVMCLTLGCVFSFVQWKQAQANLKRSLLQQDRAERNVDELHRTIVGALDISLDSLEQQVQLIPAHQEVLDQLMNAHMRLIEEEAGQFETTARTFECYERLSKIYRATARYEKATEIVERSERLLLSCMESEEGYQKFALSAVDLYMEKSAISSELGDEDEQLVYLTEAAEYHRNAESFTDRVVWLNEGFHVFRETGFCHNGEGRYDQALENFEKSGAFAKQALQLNPDDEQLQFNYAKSFVDISHVFRYQKEFHTALEFLERSEELFEAAIQNPSAQLDSRDYRYRLAYIRNEMSLCLRYAVKDYERAEEYSHWAIDALTELTEENPGHLVYQNRLSHAYQRLLDVYYVQGMFDEVLELIPRVQKIHAQGRARWAAYRMAHSERMRGKIFAYEYKDPDRALEAFDESIRVIETFEEFDLGHENLVDSMLESYWQKGIFYESFGKTKRVIDVAGKGHRLAVQRAFKYPTPRNLQKAFDRAKFYAEKLNDDGQYGLAKSALDAVADAGRDWMKVQYDVGNLWARFDFQQREAGADKEVWEQSRSRSMHHLTRAIDLGFSDYKRLRKRSKYRKYKHLPAYEANCDRIKPAEKPRSSNPM